MSSRHEPPEPSSLTRIYGFVTCITAFVLFTFYVFLALTPTRFIEEVLGEDIEGVQRIAGTIPVVVLLTIIFVMISYAFIDLMVTPSLDDYKLISDKHAKPWDDSRQDIPIIADMPKLVWSRSIAAESKRKSNGKS